MGPCGIEKPMQIVGGRHTVDRVVDVLASSDGLDRVLVSVSGNTPETERHLRDRGIETVRTSGESFMDDLHTAFEVMSGEYVMTCPSDLPLLDRLSVESFLRFFRPGRMDSAIAVIDAATVEGLGIHPSFTREWNGSEWVLSGLCIMDRPRTLAGDYLDEVLYATRSKALAVNVNTQEELELARLLCDDGRCARPDPAVRAGAGSFETHYAAVDVLDGIGEVPGGDPSGG